MYFLKSFVVWNMYFVCNSTHFLYCALKINSIYYLIYWMFIIRISVFVKTWNILCGQMGIFNFILLYFLRIKTGPIDFFYFEITFSLLHIYIYITFMPMHIIVHNRNNTWRYFRLCFILDDSCLEKLNWNIQKVQILFL